MTWMAWREAKYISFFLENGLDAHKPLAACTTHSRNSRFYRPVSRRNSDWFLDLRIYRCRYDREEDTTFFSEISIYLRWSSFLYIGDFQTI